jgi:hypothetical protein
MKLLLISAFVLFTSSVIAQKQYRATYRDTTSMLFLPGNLQFDQLKEKGLDDDAVKTLSSQLMAQLTKIPMQGSQLRKVRTRGDSTIIVFDKKTRTGNLTVHMPDSMLLIKSRVYMSDSLGKGFSKTPDEPKERSFRLTGSSKKILNYTCNEYQSTDSTVRIWVAENMPTSINPGIRVGNTKGAVLAFELMSGSLFTKCELIKLESCRRVARETSYFYME